MRKTCLFAANFDGSSRISQSYLCISCERFEKLIAILTISCNLSEVNSYAA
jgi:hypothetical protein